MYPLPDAIEFTSKLLWSCRSRGTWRKSGTATLQHLHVGYVLFDDGAVVVDVQQWDSLGGGRRAARQSRSQTALSSEVQQHRQVSSSRIVLPRTNCTNTHTHSPHSAVRVVLTQFCPEFQNGVRD